MIRPATAADLAAIAPLAGSRDRAEVRLRSADTTHVAVRAGRIVGVASLRWSGSCDPPHPWLYGLHVAADSRRAGVGRALVAAMEASAHGATHVSLDVDVDDPRAIAFYETLGYTVVRPHDHHWRSLDPRTGAVLAEGVAPTLLMRRELR